MEFFIFKTLQVLSRESAIAMVTKILFFARRRSRRAKKDCSGRSDPSCGFGVGEGIATLINYLDCFVVSLRFTPRNGNAAVLSLASLVPTHKKTSKKFRRFLSYS